MQAQERLLHWSLWLNQFFFPIEHIQGSKNSLRYILTRELTNGDHKSITPTEKRENPI